MSKPTLCSLVSDDFMNNLKMGKKLGQGTYGSVRLMQTNDKSQSYAVKKQSVTTHPEDLGVTQPILLDSDALVRLRHVPEVIQLIGICYGTDAVFIIMEAMDFNLRDYYLTMAKTERIKLAPLLLLNLVRAAAIFESLNINHFDIKPQNILVKATNPPRFVVTDFGISRASFSQYHIPRTEVFTRWYRPPEFLAGRPRETFHIYRGDIWAIAATVVEFMVGTPLFPGDSEIDMLRRIYDFSTPASEWATFEHRNKAGTITGFIDLNRILQNNIPSGLIPNLDPAIVTILSRMLSLNPNDRPTGHDVLAAFRQSITPEFFQTLQPPTYTRFISKTQFDIILELGDRLHLSRATTIIALEIITRFLGIVEGIDTEHKNNIYALAALHAANKFNESLPVETYDISYAYNTYFVSLHRTFSRVNVSIKEIADAERDLLHKIDFLVYNINLTPAINRSYKYHVIPRNVPLIDYSKPISQWFT